MLQFVFVVAIQQYDNDILMTVSRTFFNNIITTLSVLLCVRAKRERGDAFSLYSHRRPTCCMPLLTHWITIITASPAEAAVGAGAVPSLPWPSPATAPAGCRSLSPSGAAGWSRWCLALRWECALYSCQLHNLQPKKRDRWRKKDRGCHTICNQTEIPAAKAGCVFPSHLRGPTETWVCSADSLIQPQNEFCKHISSNWVISSSLRDTLPYFLKSALSGYSAKWKNI